MGFSSPPPPSKPLFFKVLLPGSLKKLSVPPKFVRKHLSHVNLSKNRATIKSPLGRSWDVCVHVNKEGHFFEDGWCVFVRDHDLHMGDFLVFKYKGCLDFNVKLFDSSGCEKEYPPSARNRSEEHTDWTKIDKPPTTSPSRMALLMFADFLSLLLYQSS
ncbi:B3 domain-containing protein REM6 [Acorus gramineus]|uniref:B3 domain-containing protein REM6 n=1 Tax=Acorus gramineus TaxID=55184 RepID=A0AAV9AVH1_ACOGR|nr:B3 domain-containing protein REM6 [Acorus gramineus]